MWGSEGDERRSASMLAHMVVAGRAEGSSVAGGTRAFSEAVGSSRFLARG